MLVVTKKCLVQKSINIQKTFSFPKWPFFLNAFSLIILQKTAKKFSLNGQLEFSSFPLPEDAALSDNQKVLGVSTDTQTLKNKCSFCFSFLFRFRGVFRTLTNICDRVFLQNYFSIKYFSIIDTGQGIKQSVILQIYEQRSGQKITLTVLNTLALHLSKRLYRFDLVCVSTENIDQ